MTASISDSYRDLNKSLHKDEKYGSRADAGGLAGNLPKALSRLNNLGVCSSYLDYGCGKGNLVKEIKRLLSSQLEVAGYDPSVEEFNELPSKRYDFVTCLDVLEHIEPQHITDTLKKLCDLTGEIAYIAIDLQPAVKKLSNGRNAHIMLAPPEWWTSKISEYYSYLVSFPVKHKEGFNQKIVFFATNKSENMELLFLTASKIKSYKLLMSGGLDKRQ